MGNVTHILPVSQWLEVVIAFVSSQFILHLLSLFYCQLHQQPTAEMKKTNLESIEEL